MCWRAVVSDAISEAGAALAGSLARAQCQPESRRGPGQACGDRDGGGQPGI